MKNYNEIYDAKQMMGHMMDDAYSKGYDKAYNDRKIEEDEDRAKAIEDAYRRGLDDAWKCASRIAISTSKGGISAIEACEIFGMHWDEVFSQYSASEAIAKIKEYEVKKKADDEIKVGDEVMVDERCMIVLGIDSGKWKHLWCPSNGFTYSNILTSEMTKTGRHFDIPSIFDQMKDE